MSQTSKTDDDVPQLYLGMFTSTEYYGVREFACVIDVLMCIFPELYFLIAKFLNAGPCQQAAEV